MPNCPSLANCPFFNDKMKSKPATMELYKKKYCLADYTSCARYQVSKQKGKEFVPLDLFPNETHRVNSIIHA